MYSPFRLSPADGHGCQLTTLWPSSSLLLQLAAGANAPTAACHRLTIIAFEFRFEEVCSLCCAAGFCLFLCRHAYFKLVATFKMPAAYLCRATCASALVSALAHGHVMQDPLHTALPAPHTECRTSLAVRFPPPAATCSSHLLTARPRVKHPPIEARPHVIRPQCTHTRPDALLPRPQRTRPAARLFPRNVARGATSSWRNAFLGALLLPVDTEELSV